MTKSQVANSEMYRKLRMIGIPDSVTSNLVTTINRQVAAEGPENVVKRLKVLKQAAVCYLSETPVVFDWISHDKGTMIPKGAWKPIWKMLMSSRYKQRKRAFNAVMVYASLVLPKQASPTRVQEKKFLESVTISDDEVTIRQRKLAEALSAGYFSKGVSFLRKYLTRKQWSNKLPETPEIMEYYAQRYGTNKAAAHKLERVLGVFLGQDAGRNFQSFPQVKRILGVLGSDYFDLTHPWNGSFANWWDQPEWVDTEPVGVIGSSQEPGYKFRAFAAPNIVLQCAMEPLKLTLMQALGLLEWDCTHDQEKGVETVRKWLKEGKTCYSVDLSDATNNFPLSLQLNTLEYLGIPKEDIRLMEMISRSPFKVMWEKDKCVRWNVGQPLGLGPSFAAFALTHAVVALDSELAAGVPRENLGSTFRILGDDFITNDENVHNEYRKRLGLLSCPISESKCLISSVSGEFAGKLIQSDYTYHGYKYKEVSDRSFMDVVKTLGSRAIRKKVLSEKQYNYCRLVREIPEPWGLGFNPKGRSFADRYEEYLVLKEAMSYLKSDTVLSRREELIAALRGNFHRWEYIKHEWDAQPEYRSEPIKRDLSTKGQILEMIMADTDLASTTVQRGDPRSISNIGLKEVDRLVRLARLVRESQV